MPSSSKTPARVGRSLTRWPTVSWMSMALALSIPVIAVLLRKIVPLGGGSPPGGARSVRSICLLSSTSVVGFSLWLFALASTVRARRIRLRSARLGGPDSLGAPAFGLLRAPALGSLRSPHPPGATGRQASLRERRPSRARSSSVVSRSSRSKSSRTPRQRACTAHARTCEHGRLPFRKHTAASASGSSASTTSASRSSPAGRASRYPPFTPRVAATIPARPRASRILRR
jgi:hypothetical protein